MGRHGFCYQLLSCSCPVRESSIASINLLPGSCWVSRLRLARIVEGFIYDGAGWFISFLPYFLRRGLAFSEPPLYVIQRSNELHHFPAPSRLYKLAPAHVNQNTPANETSDLKQSPLLDTQEANLSHLFAFIKRMSLLYYSIASNVIPFMAPTVTSGLFGVAFDFTTCA